MSERAGHTAEDYAVSQHNLAAMQAEVFRLRTLLHSTCAVFGHLWPEKRPKRSPRNVRCAACGMSLWALNSNGNEEFTDA